MITEPIRKMSPAVSQRGNKQGNGGVRAPRPQSEVRPAQSPSVASTQGNFFGVRLHPEAAEVTAPLQARAVTHGQDVYFHPGQFRPGTPQGETLIAHELAHTLQTRHSAGAGARGDAFVSRPGDALERNADALARGETTQALAAPAGAALRSPFDSESATEKTRREQLLQSVNNAANRLINVLQTSALLSFETATTSKSGTRGIVIGPLGPNAPFIGYTERNAQIRRIIGALQNMGMQYRSNPVSSGFSPPTLDKSSGMYMSSVPLPKSASKVTGVNFQGQDPSWVDLQAAYERYVLSQGFNTQQSPYDTDWFYLDPTNKVLPGAAQGAPRLSSGIQTGTNLVFPDIDNEPLRFWRLTGHSPHPPGSVIVEAWVDQLGYYYTHRGQRIDIPNPHVNTP